jgi:hypothetical protein
MPEPSKTGGPAVWRTVQGVLSIVFLGMVLGAAYGACRGMATVVERLIE